MLILGALAFAIGIAGAHWTRLDVMTGGGTAPLALVFVAALLLLCRRRSRWRALGLVALTWLGGGALRLIECTPLVPPALVDDEPYTIEATVESTERVLQAMELVVTLNQVSRGATTQSVSGLRALVTIRGEPVELLLPGDAIHWVGRLRTVEGPANPGADDGANRSYADGVALRSTVVVPTALVRWARPVAPGVRRSVAALRERMRVAVVSTLSGRQRALVLSLVLGDRSFVEPALDEAFRAAGVSHVLSVSGLHLAMAAFLFCFAVDRLVRRCRWLVERWPARRVAAAASIPAVLLYTLLTGAEVATVRSCIVAVVYLGARVLDRRAATTEALLLGAWLLLAAAPHQLFVASFQLSVAAALGTALAARRLSARARPSEERRWWQRLARWAWSLFWVSLAALALTAPLAAWHFSQLSITGLGANLLVVPLAELFVVPVGLVGAALTAASPHFAWVLRVAGWGAEWMARIVDGCAHFTPSLWVPQPTVLELAAWYGVALSLLVGGRYVLRMALVSGVLLAGAVGWRVVAPRLWPELRVTFMDVGQGDACVIELPSGHAIVVDGGGSFDASYDPGERILAPFLHRRGIGHLDLVALSHPHPDHANGLPYLVDHFPVDEIWPAAEVSQLPAQRALIAAAHAHHISLGPARSFSADGVTVKMLGPRELDGGYTADPAASENDNSLVFTVEYAGRRLLFAGDIEAPAEKRLLALGGLGHVDVVKVPHHGSPTSSTAPFVAALTPGWAVISVGRDNRWHFPSPAVTARWRGQNADVLRTDRDGAITITIGRDGAIHAHTER